MQNVPGKSLGVVVFWRYLVVTVPPLNSVCEVELDRIGFSLFSFPFEIGVSNCIPMSKSQSPLKHTVLYVYGCCHRNKGSWFFFTSPFQFVIAMEIPHVSDD